MLCQKELGKELRLLMLCVGVVSAVFGLVTFLVVKPETHHINTLLGMFTGFGFGIIGVAVYQVIRSKTLSTKKLEQQNIERNDERNIAIAYAARSTCFYAGMLLLIILAFLFTALGYLVPSYLCIGSIYVLLGIYMVAHKVYKKKL